MLSCSTNSLTCLLNIYYTIFICNKKFAAQNNFSVFLYYSKYNFELDFFVLKMLQFQEKAFEIWFRRFISVDVVLYLEVPQKKMLTKWKKFLWLLLIITTCCAKMPRKFVQLFHVNTGMCLSSFPIRFFHSVCFLLDEYLQGLEWLNSYMYLHMSSLSQV